MTRCQVCMIEKDNTIILFENTDYEVRACKECTEEAKHWFIMLDDVDAPAIEDVMKCGVCEKKNATLTVSLPPAFMLTCVGCEGEARELLCERACERAEEESDPDSPHYLIDGVGFADPGGNSALRAAGPGNPRNLPCPNCGEPDRLTPADRAKGYQCDQCADALERGGP